MKYLAILVTLLSMVCCATAEEPGKGWLQFEMKKIQVGIITVHYDPVYEKDLDFIKSTFQKFDNTLNAKVKILTKSEAIVDDINNILGETDKNKKGQVKTLNRFAGIFKDIKKMSFYVIPGMKIKDFLRKGGELPDCSYDKENDECAVKFSFETKSSLKNEHMQSWLPVPPGQKLEESLGSFIKRFSAITGHGAEGLAIHEVAEMTLQLRIIARNPYLRWFADGTANAVAYEILKKHISKERADDFIRHYNIDKYKELTSEVNLQYWTLAKYAIAAEKISEFASIENARYSFATHEMRWLVKKHGIGCIKKIMDEMCIHDAQTDDLIINVIKKVTGKDMTVRLKRYQTFETKEQGLKKYLDRVKEAMKKSDAKGLISNSSRMLELYRSPFLNESLKRRVTIALVLYQTGHKDLADEMMKGCVNFLNEPGIENIKLLANQVYMTYATKTNRPEIALSHAEEVLKKHPEDNIALGTKMFALARKGKIQQAKPIAEKIIKLTIKEKDYNDLAQKVIKIAEHQAKSKKN